MKRLIALLMALTMIFTLSCPAYAATSEMVKLSMETMRGKQIETSINGLLESYKATNDEDKQVAIFDELVACYSELNSMAYYRSDIMPLSSNYVTIVDTPDVNNNRATITYQVLMAIPNGVTVNVGFEYPSAWRQSSPTFIANRSVGTYTQTISTNIMMGARYFTRMTAHTYTEKQTFGIYYAGLETDGSWNDFPHTIGLTEVQSNEIATEIAFNLISNKTLITTGGTLICKLILKLAGTAIDTYQRVCPSGIQAGQCNVISIRFVGNTVYIKDHRYTSSAAYSSGGTPIETSTHSFSLSGYPAN